MMKVYFTVLLVSVSIAIYFYATQGNESTGLDLNKYVGRFYITKDLIDDPAYADKTKFVSHLDIPIGYKLRVYHTGDMLTMDYSETRINFELNETQQVVKAYIG